MSPVLTTYLQDHHAGSAAGVAAFDRVAASHGDETVRTALARIADDVREDQAALESIMERVGAKPSTLKDAAGSLGEKLGRLKPNERIVSRSPLSDLLELEALVGAVHLKGLLWESLQIFGDPRLDDVELDRLRERANAQEAELSDLRRTQVPKLLQD